MRRKRYVNGEEIWEDRGPGVGRRHTPAPPDSVVNYMATVTSVADARRELDAHVIPLVVSARENAQQADTWDIAA